MLKLSDMLASDGFQQWEADKLRHLPWEDPDMNSRVEAEAVSGGEGRTHREVIAGWREYIGECLTAHGVLSDTELDALLDEVDVCESRHEAAGDLDNVVG